MDQDIIEAIPIPALLVAQAGQILATNDGARGLFGAAIQGRHYITALRQPNLLDAVERAVTSQKTSVAPYLSTEARRDITWQATCTPLPDRRVLIALEDRTAMEDAFQMRRDFVANVSHELRTPLTALLGFIETLRGAARNDEEARERFLGIMEREAGRMNRLVADLLSLSRVEADERVRPTAMVDINGIVRGVAHTLTPVAEANEIALALELPDKELLIPGDADQLNQVVTNLIENAVKYSDGKGPVSVELGTQANHPALRGDAIVLIVQDRGEGIDPVHIPRLTERFYRIDNHRSREMGGTGLGLAIVKHIVHRHRGRLRIESEKGTGSRFSVILPLQAS